MPRIIVIGSSLGGIEALRQVVSGFAEDLPAAVFIVQHMDSRGLPHLAGILSRAGKLLAATSEDGETIDTGRIYLPPPDHHLVVKQGFVRVVRGPRENCSRPAIDVLFRSAAAAYGAEVVGVVLTGMLNDGANGLLAVKRCGGTTLVQDPATAVARDMPENALRAAGPDFVLPLGEIGPTLDRIVRSPAPAAASVPADVAAEARIAEGCGDPAAFNNQFGQLAPVTCAECGGPLWEINESHPSRFRCRVGHSYTRETLVLEQQGTIESSLWAALRAIEDRMHLLDKLASDVRGPRVTGLEQRYLEQRDEWLGHAQVIRKMLTGTEEG